MSVRFDRERGIWFVDSRYRGADGTARRKTRRGFGSREAAEEWERDFAGQDPLGMTLSEFWAVYEQDVRPQLKSSTWRTKEYVFRSKIEPALGGVRVRELTAKEVLDWQNSLAAGAPGGRHYSGTYLRTVANQLGAVLSHAQRFYGLASNP